MRFLIEGGGLRAVAMKQYATAILGWTSPQNKMFRRATERINEMVQAGDLDVKVQVDLTSWAPAHDLPLLETRTSRLARAVQSWGDTDVRELSGEPVEGLFATTPGLAVASPANVTCALLSDIVQMLPFFRPSSPWKTGALMLRTGDGRLFPFQPSSATQSNWINIVIAEPRAGKSVLVNAINLCLCVAPGLDDLPYIAIIDIGRASSGFTSLLREALPPSERHKVAQFRLRMRPEDAINIFDTQLGCRFPLPHEEATIVNFLTLLMTPPGREAPDDGMADLCAFIVEEAYKMCADGASPKKYSQNIQGAEIVDQAIKDYGLHIDNNTTWWEVVDELFRKGASHAAGVAQRFAVPHLQDLPVLAADPAVRNLYQNKRSDVGGEPLLDTFNRLISSAIKKYPILTRPTAFDVSDARVVSIDLDEVAKQGSAAADHQTNVCYMLARHVAARNFYLREEDIPMFPSEYRAFHEQRIREIRKSRKHLVFDEVHRTSRSASTRAQLELDAREGGKWGVMLTPSATARRTSRTPS